MPIGSLKGLQSAQVLVASARREPFPDKKIALPFAAQFAEVEVNTRTREIRVLRLLGAHDSGRVMNRSTYDNQVFGGMTMGLGYALTEVRILDQATGRMVNANWHDYGIPTALDVPGDWTCVPIGPHDTECNSTGAKGLGEPATIPTAPVITNTVFHATDVRLTETPMTPAQGPRRLSTERPSPTGR